MQKHCTYLYLNSELVGPTKSRDIHLMQAVFHVKTITHNATCNVAYEIKHRLQGSDKLPPFQLHAP